MTTTELSNRQRQIAIHIATGLEAKKIGLAMGISTKTVEKHREIINLKLREQLDLRIIGTAAITRFVIGMGWVKPLFVPQAESLGNNNVDILSVQQINVAKLVALGFGNKQVGNALGISTSTAKNHRGKINKKLKKKLRLAKFSTAGMTRYAVAMGWVKALFVP